MAHTYIWNEDTQQREKVEDREALIQDLVRRAAETEAAALTPAPSIAPSPADAAPAVAPMSGSGLSQDVTGPVDAPKPVKPKSER